jgi:hypothetical protein
MLEALPSEYKPSGELMDKAKELDRHYISTRCLNFHPEDAPLDYYTKEDAKKRLNIQRKLQSTAKLKFFKLNYEEVMERLKEYAEKTIAKGVKAVILIESLARGDYTAFFRCRCHHNIRQSA